MKQERKHKISGIFTDMLFYVAGGTLFALSVNMFTVPNDILLGGFTAVAEILHTLVNAPIGTTLFLLNVPLFLIALRKFGFRFIVKTIAATFIVSAVIDLSAPFVPAYTGDKLLSALFGGILSGAGLGVVFLRGATTGGTDILSKLLRLRFPQLSMGRMILLFDLLVIAASFFVYHSLENMLYALVVIYISAQVIDLVQTGFSHDKLLFVVTDQSECVVRELTQALDRGVSVLDMRGGYTGNPHKMLFCAVRANDVARVKERIREMDENAFIVISEISDILGEGFRQRPEF